VPGSATFPDFAQGLTKSGVVNAEKWDMGASHIAVLAAISLSGLVPSSCSKVFSAREAKNHNTNTNAAAADTNVAAITPENTRDLGELDLTNHYETSVYLGAGRSCTISPILLDRDNLQLTLTLQSKQADGKTAGLVVTRVTTHPGKPFEVAIGDMDITITPQIGKE